MTEQENEEIKNYILKANVEEVEFYEELYDHIASSYENRSIQSQTIKEHLELVISPAFNHMKGIDKMVRVQRRLRKKALYRKVASEFLSFFTTSSGVIRTLIIVLAINAFSTFTEYNALVWLGGSAINLTALIVCMTLWQFNEGCITNNLPYKSSFTNRTIYFISVFLYAFLQALPIIIGQIFWGERFSIIQYAAQFEFLQLPLTLLFIIYAWVCFKLMKNRVRLEIILES